MHLIGSAQYKLFGAASAGYQAHTQLYKSRISFGSRTYFICMQAQFTGSTQGQAMRGYYYWYRRIAGTHHGILEKTDGHIQFVILLLNSQHKDHAYIGTGRKVGAFIGNDQPFIIFLRFINRCLDTGQHITTNAAHLGRPLQAQYIIADIIKPAAAVFPYYLILVIAEHQECFCAG